MPMQVDATTTVALVAGFSVFNLLFGYVIGHFGVSQIKTDIEIIKGLIHGQAKVTVVPAGSVTSVTPATTPGISVNG